LSHSQFNPFFSKIGTNAYSPKFPIEIKLKMPYNNARNMDIGTDLKADFYTGLEV
jgi:hypothetical protein